MATDQGTVRDTQRLYYKEAIMKKEGSKNWVEYYASLFEKEMIFNRKDPETGLPIPNNCTSISLSGKTTCGYGEKTCYRFPFWIRTSKGTYQFKCETKFQRYKWMFAVRLCVSGKPPEAIPSLVPTQKTTKKSTSKSRGTWSPTNSLNATSGKFSRTVRVPFRRTQTESGDIELSKQGERRKASSKIVSWDLAKPLTMANKNVAGGARKLMRQNTRPKSNENLMAPSQASDAKVQSVENNVTCNDSLDLTAHSIAANGTADILGHNANDSDARAEAVEAAHGADRISPDADVARASMSKRFFSALERSMQKPAKSVRKRMHLFKGESKVRKISIKAYVHDDDGSEERAGSRHTICSENGSETSGETNSTFASSRNSSRSSVACSPLLHDPLEQAFTGMRLRMPPRALEEAGSLQAEHALCSSEMPGFISENKSDRLEFCQVPSKSLSWASLNRVRSPLDTPPRRENSAPPLGPSTNRMPARITELRLERNQHNSVTSSYGTANEN